MAATLVGFGPYPTIDPATGAPTVNADIQFFALTDSTFSTPLTYYDEVGNSLGNTFHVADYPSIPKVYLYIDLALGDYEVWAKSGNFITAVPSFDALVMIALTNFVVQQQSAADSATAAQQALQQVQQYIASGGGGSGGGLPANTTLDNIPNGSNRLAMTQAERDKLSSVAANATALTLGTDNKSALAGDSLTKLKPSDIGAMQNVAGFGRGWVRTAAQGFPTVAEGLLEGDVVAIEAS